MTHSLKFQRLNLSNENKLAELEFYNKAKYYITQIIYYKSIV